MPDTTRACYVNFNERSGSGNAPDPFPATFPQRRVRVESGPIVGMTSNALFTCLGSDEIT